MNRKFFGSCSIDIRKKEVRIALVENLFRKFQTWNTFARLENTMAFPLSVVIITFNEEKNISRCIESVLPIADEIVVVDSYSTDRTQEICLSYGVRFLQHPFVGHIEQKNYALRQAQYDYVLSLDADEALSESLLSAIQGIKHQFNFDGYIFNRKTNFCGKWVSYCGWYPDKKLRLWDRNKGSWGGTNPHDKVILLKGATVKQIPYDILHYSFNTIDEHFKQIEYFTDISSKAAYQRGQTSSSLKIWGKSIFKFFRDYFLKLGFLDGKTGFIICKNSAYAKYLKYSKLRDLHRSHE